MPPDSKEVPACPVGVACINSSFCSSLFLFPFGPSFRWAVNALVSYLGRLSRWLPTRRKHQTLRSNPPWEGMVSSIVMNNGFCDFLLMHDIKVQEGSQEPFQPPGVGMPGCKAAHNFEGFDLSRLGEVSKLLVA